jgi:hypothetical protein
VPLQNVRVRVRSHQRLQNPTSSWHSAAPTGGRGANRFGWWTQGSQRFCGCSSEEAAGRAGGFEWRWVRYLFHELVAYVTPRASNDYETPGDGILPGHREGEFIFRNPKGPGRPVPEIPAPASTARRSSESVTTARQHMALGDARSDVGDWDGAATEYRNAIRL